MKTTYTFEFKEHGPGEWLESNRVCNTLEELEIYVKDWKKDFINDKIRIKRTTITENVSSKEREWVEGKIVKTYYKYL